MSMTSARSNRPRQPRVKPYLPKWLLGAYADSHSTIQQRAPPTPTLMWPPRPGAWELRADAPTAAAAVVELLPEPLQPGFRRMTEHTAR